MEDIILFAGETGDEETGDGWLPAVTLQHGGRNHEMYVVVGEEVGGMIESVPPEVFEAIRENVTLSAAKAPEDD